LSLWASIEKMRDMVDFDLEKFLDHAGVELGGPGITAGDSIFLPTDRRLSGGNLIKYKAPLTSEELGKQGSRKSQLFRPCSILKTKMLFPLTFMCDSNGGFGEGAVDIASTAFSLRENVMFMMLEEGVLLASDQNLSSKLEAKVVESRYIKGLAIFENKNAPWIEKGDTDKSGFIIYGGKKHIGPVIFYVLFSVDATKEQAEEQLFEVMHEGTKPQSDVTVLDFTDKLYMRQPFVTVVHGS